MQRHLAEYRALRGELEDNLLAIASSVDGRRFEFQAPLQRLRAPARRLRDAGRAARPGALHPARARRRRPGRVGGRPRAEPAEPPRDPRRPRRGRDPGRRRARRSTTRPCGRRPPRRWPRGSAGLRARRCRWASCGSHPASRSRSTPAASTATRSSAASRARASPTRSASCSSSCCSATDMRVVVLDPNSDFARFAAVRAGADARLAARWRELRAGHRRAAGGDRCGCACASSAARRRPRCSGSTRSPTGRSTRSWPSWSRPRSPTT